MTADTVIRARIDSDTKEQATAVLEVMGLSVSDAIRMLMRRIADEKCLPFDGRVPNVTARKAMSEINNGGGQRFEDAGALFRDLGI